MLSLTDDDSAIKFAKKITFPGLVAYTLVAYKKHESMVKINNISIIFVLHCKLQKKLKITYFTTNQYLSMHSR